MNEVNLQDQEIERLLTLWVGGDVGVEEKLIELLYPHIHKIAQVQRKPKTFHAMQTTEIVNETFIKLHNKKHKIWQNKSHFLAITAKVVRAVMVDDYRAEHRQKRGGAEQHLTFDRVSEFIQEQNSESMNWLELDDLLSRLHKIDSEAAQVVEYKVFGGLTIPEMSAVLNTSESTVSRNWNFAKSWMLMELK